MVNKLYFDKQVDFWNSVLNPDNMTVGQLNLDNFDLERNLAFYYTPAQEYAYSRMGKLQGKDILELGCGMGLNAVIMARKGANVTAVDIAQRRVEWVNNLAKKYSLKNINAVCMSAEDLRFKKESFDVIYSNELLIHTNRAKTLAECCGVLRKGGKAIFVESLKFHPLVNLYRKGFAPKIYGCIAEHLTLKEIEAFRTFFSEVHHREFYLLTFLAFFWQFGIQNKGLFKFSLDILHKADEFIYLYFPSLRYFSWMTCIECVK